MRLFVRVAERGSFVRAADDFELARSQVSTQVAALEAALGVRLLNRTTRRVSLTPDGGGYLERCRRALEEIDAAEEALRRDRGRVSGRLRVDVPVAFGRSLLIPALPEFTHRYPGLELDVRLEDRVTDLIAERIDVAVRVGRIRQQDLVARRTPPMRVFTCAAPSYLAAAGVPSTPADLVQHRCIGIANPQTGRVGQWDFRRGNVRRTLRLEHALTFNSVEASVLAAVRGLGVTRTIDLMVAPYLASGELHVVLPEWASEGPAMSIVYPAAGRGSAKVRVFADFAVALIESAMDRAAGYLQRVSV
jgi:LysR family transcriptional regulator, regulator for bpeEF and oprC